MKAFLALLLIPAIACAQSDDRSVPEALFDDYDVEALKAGEWSLQETVSEKPGAGGKAVRSGHRDRRACVKADKATVWIEVSTWDLEAKAADLVTLCEVDRKMRKVVKAWVSEKGAVGTEAKVAAAEEAAPPAGEEGGSGASSGAPGKEKVRVGKREVLCDGLEIDWYHPDENYKTVHSKMSVWFSAELPFRLRLADPAVRAKNRISEDLNGNLKTSKALVRVESEGEVDGAKTKESTIVLDFGTNAKATVKTE
ncbi:MAG: hypothetical protein HYY18_17725 [Planctomycetes bacterium]|nr:hypothetical protein [Planctomycetota bacterium]